MTANVFLLKLEPDDPAYHFAPPFGILYLGSALENQGFSVELRHETGTASNIQRIVAEVLAAKPLFVGISTLSGPSLLPSRAVSRMIKASSSIPLVWGGLHPTMLPLETLAYDFVDIIGVGEGEETIVELAQAFSASGLDAGRLESIRGIGFKENGRAVINPSRAFIPDLDRYSPSWDRLKFEKYIYGSRYFYSELGSKLPGDRIAAVITSRGCPWRCAYCYNQFVNKRTFRAHSVDRVRRELDILRDRHKITAVIFEDDDFFGNKDRALAIIRGMDIPWSSSIRANYLARWGEDFARELQAHRCVELRIGAESGTSRMLKLAQKDITVEDINRAVAICQKTGLRALLNFMIGFPGETWQEMCQTFDLMDRLEQSGKGDVVVNGPNLYMPWPGTALYEAAQAKGFLPPQKLEEWAIGWKTGRQIPPYVPRKVKYIAHYRILALRKDLAALKFPFFARALRVLARLRWKKRFFLIPLDYHLPRLGLILLSRLKLKKMTRALYE